MSEAELAPAGLTAELRERHSRITARLHEVGAACLVATRDETVTYLTGYTSTTWKSHSRPVIAVLGADGRLLVLTAETEADSARLRIPGADVRAYVQLLPVTADQRLPDGQIQFAVHAAKVLAEIIEECGPGPVAVDGLDAPWPPIGQLTRLVPDLDNRTIDASALVWELRLHKSEWELGRMRLAADVLDRAYSLLLGRIAPGMTEREIWRRFCIAQLEAGAHEVGSPAVVAGPSRGLFGGPTDRRWDADELLYLDGTAIVDGYWSDYCRTVAARSVRADETAGYARARTAQEAAVAAFSDGWTAGAFGSVMAAAMDIAPHDVGFGRFGHGIGLYVPEPPSLHPDDATGIEPGLTICIEPTVVHAGVNFVVEEEYLVRAGGLERISPPAPREILIL